MSPLNCTPLYLQIYISFIFLQDHINNLGSYITIDFDEGSQLPGHDWATKMYWETTAESWKVCRAMCHYHHTTVCKIFAYSNQRCYLGDPSGTYHTILSGEYLKVNGDYGNFSKDHFEKSLHNF